ncbi:MAG: hypothetical protein ACHP9Z_08945 [Streptosporangiales bacterium]
MTRIIWPMAAVLTAAILAAGAVLTARSLRPAVRAVPLPRATVTVTAAPKVITRTRVVTRTVQAPAGVPCGVATDGLPYPPGSGTMSYESTCAVTWKISTPAALGTALVLTDPAGQSNSWSLTLAGG